VVVASPAVLVNTASYTLPFCPALARKLNVVEVAPATDVNVVPPSVLTVHCTVGVGVPSAAAVKVAVSPAFTDEFAGLAVMAGIEPTSNVAGFVVALLDEFVNTAWYKFELIAGVVAKVNVPDVAPATGV
jgi:hypothetical protein